ncbi:BnaCnng57810D [Brassica napus]|uniref:BnaCnng57810D protein n=1 Tax=Brassica napus TaxID=3708 RepID=A0A078JRU7_BRANA|nr:BnaCnng57810D [Brassica napus]
MANPQVLLADLNAGRCSNVAEVRLLRYWEARNVRKGGELMNIIGELSAIRSTITDRIAGAQRVMLTLRLERFIFFNIMVVLRDV